MYRKTKDKLQKPLKLMGDAKHRTLIMARKHGEQEHAKC